MFENLRARKNGTTHDAICVPTAVAQRLVARGTADFQVQTILLEPGQEPACKPGFTPINIIKGYDRVHQILKDEQIEFNVLK